MRRSHRATTWSVAHRVPGICSNVRMVLRFLMLSVLGENSSRNRLRGDESREDLEGLRGVLKVSAMVVLVDEGIESVLEMVDFTELSVKFL